MVVTALTLTACSGTELTERIIEGQEGVGDVEISEDDGTVEMEIMTEDGDASIVISEDDGTVEMEIVTEDGDASIVIGGGELPADFPIDVPVGGTVVSVMEAEGNTSVSLEYDDSEFASVVAFYENWVSNSGATVMSKTELSSPQVVSWLLESGDLMYNIVITEGAGQTLVTLFLTGN